MSFLLLIQFAKLIVPYPNIIEGYHRQLRKVTKTKTAYPSDEALRKIIYLATVDAAKKWTMPLRNWTDCISQLMIYFDDRLDARCLY